MSSLTRLRNSTLELRTRRSHSCRTSSAPLLAERLSRTGPLFSAVMKVFGYGRARHLIQQFQRSRSAKETSPIYARRDSTAQGFVMMGVAQSTKFTIH